MYNLKRQQNIIVISYIYTKFNLNITENVEHYVV